MKKIIKQVWFWIILIALNGLGGCSQYVATTAALDESKLPWGRPSYWERTNPIAPGFQY